MSQSSTVESPATSNHYCSGFVFKRAGNHEDDEDVDDHNPRLGHGDEVLTREQNSATPDLLRRRQGEGDEPEVLEPDHPLMKRFQAALKNHLQRQYNRLTDEILELKAEIKKKKFEHEEIGVQLYDMQQHVMKQQVIIDSYHETISNMGKIRHEMEAQVEAYKNTYKCEQQKLSSAQKKGCVCHNNF